MVGAHQPHKVVALSEIKGYPGPGSLTWHPVRATLGVRAFGCNAYTARKVGDDVVEPHTEAPGTYVFIPDSDSHRLTEALAKLETPPL